MHVFLTFIYQTAFTRHYFSAINFVKVNNSIQFKTVQENFAKLKYLNLKCKFLLFYAKNYDKFVASNKTNLLESNSAK